MPRAAWCRPEIYDFFDRWRRECLIRDGALFTAGQVWSDEHLSTLQTTLGTELIGGGTFFEKLRTQLEPHPPEVRQLGVEIAYVEYLGERDTGVVTKQTNIQALFDLLPNSVTVPADLWEILDGGIASYGPGKSYRDAYVRFLSSSHARPKRRSATAGPRTWRTRGDSAPSSRASAPAPTAWSPTPSCTPASPTSSTS